MAEHYRYIPSYVQRLTQKQQVLWYIDIHGSITARDAWNAFELGRLAAIIKFLEKDDDYIFDHRDETNKLSGKSYTRYFLLGGPGIEDGQLGLGLGGK